MHVSAKDLNMRHPADGAASSGARLLGRHAARQVALRFEFQVVPYLVIEFSI